MPHTPGLTGFYLRFAYQLRRLDRGWLDAVLRQDAARFSALCDAIDRALPRARRRNFTFTGVDRTGRDLVVCWELDDDDRPGRVFVFDGELAEQRAERTRALPRLTGAGELLARRRGCARLG